MCAFPGYFTRAHLEQIMCAALRESGAPPDLDQRVLDDMVMTNAAQLPLMRPEQLAALYNKTRALPHTATKALIRSETGIVIIGPFVSSTPVRSRSTLLIGMKLPKGKMLLVKVPSSREDAKRERNVYEQLWSGPLPPPHLVGPAEYLDRAFHSHDANRHNEMELSGHGHLLKYALAIPKYQIALQDVPRPHDPEFALATGRQIRCAMEFMHDKGLGHTDVKASNIFLDGEGTRYLGDFGSSVELGQELQEVTYSHLPGGGPAVVRVSIDHASTALDFFALAVTLLDTVGATKRTVHYPDPVALVAIAQELENKELSEFVVTLIQPVLHG
ncbi:hypothetical protein JKP88DRAFT_240806 [Tribonema minus]|uniref:Protein kinase domain-containing protein n=1 Tax=Tribonema minus TaxID=303371 RepID=A0A835ZQE2_9STRA|nr:hypothetical protein JKP88DRAFT_240806 [Tribonema minus]